jgi:uncharacterized phage protein (TIGR02218 family)
MSIEGAIRGGILENSWCDIFRLYWTNTDPVYGAGILTYSGRTGDITLVRGHVQVEINSYLELLNIQMPRNLYTTTCIHNLYATACGVHRPDYTEWAQIGSGSTKSALVITGLTHRDNGWFDQGIYVADSGWTRRTVKWWWNNVIYLSRPLVTLPAVGTWIQLAAGCDKLWGTCGNKFGNQSRYGGFPYIPKPESALL